MADATTVLAEPYHSAYDDHRKAVKRWLEATDKISPASPDYAERLRLSWESHGVSESFWELEKLVVPDQVEYKPLDTRVNPWVCSDEGKDCLE